MAYVGTYGVEANADLRVDWVRSDNRPWTVRNREAISKTGPTIVIAAAIVPILIPAIADVMLIAAFLLFFFFLNRIPKPVCDAPKIRIKIFGRNYSFGDGIFFVATDPSTGRGMFLGDNKSRRHLVIMGTTGSGKTVFLLGLVWMALLNGSGVVYVDGKADTDVFWALFSIARRLDRIDDLLIMNYLTGGEEAGSNRNPYKKLSNTNNSFQSASSGAMTELLVGLMREAGGDGAMWKGRAKALMSGLLRCLAIMRNNGECQLGIEIIRENMPLPMILDLATRTDLSQFATNALRRYLLDLPGMTPTEIENWRTGDKKLTEKASEQHNYLTMQLTEIMSELGDVFRHIFGVTFGEVNWKNVVFRRKILFVMLPVLEKTGDSLGNLGKIIFSGIRSALGPALGYKIEGSHDRVIKAKPTRSTVPMLMIFDEWGNYATPGAAAISSQARSLGIFLVFGTQDLPGMKKTQEVEKESLSILGNTYTKICMKIEECQETYKFFNERAGQANVEKRDGSERKHGVISNTYIDRSTTSIREENRINVRDLVNQASGKAHVLFDDELIRGNLFFIAPDNVPLARINQFVHPEMPIISEIQNKKKLFAKFDSLITGKNTSISNKLLDNFVVFNKFDSAVSRCADLETFIKYYSIAEEKSLSKHESSMIGLGCVELKTRLVDEQLAAMMNNSKKPAATQQATPLNSNDPTGFGNVLDVFNNGTNANNPPASDAASTLNPPEQPKKATSLSKRLLSILNEKGKQHAKKSGIPEDQLNEHNLENQFARASALSLNSESGEVPSEVIEDDVRKSISSVDALSANIVQSGREPVKKEDAIKAIANLINLIDIQAKDDSQKD